MNCNKYLLVLIAIVKFINTYNNRPSITGDNYNCNKA